MISRIGRSRAMRRALKCRAHECSVMSIVRSLAVSLVCSCVWASGACAQTYPNRPITMMVAFPPGGADDAIARIIHEPMEKALGQPIVIENIGGAGGMIGAAKAARAAP